MNEVAERCVAACREAHRACLVGALPAAGDADGRLLRLTLQTAQLTELMSDFLLGEAPVAGRTALVCAELAELCAGEWRGRDRELADTCADAARTCRDLAREIL